MSPSAGALAPAGGGFLLGDGRRPAARMLRPRRFPDQCWRLARTALARQRSKRRSAAWFVSEAGGGLQTGLLQSLRQLRELLRDIGKHVAAKLSEDKFIQRLLLGGELRH